MCDIPTKTLSKIDTLQTGYNGRAEKSQARAKSLTGGAIAYKRLRIKTSRRILLNFVLLQFDPPDCCLFICMTEFGKLLNLLRKT